MVASILAWINMALGVALAFFSLRYLHNSSRHIARWVKILYAAIGIYWGSLYLFVAINPPGVIDPVWFGQVWVRPAFTITIAVMTAGAIYRWRSHDD